MSTYERLRDHLWAIDDLEYSGPAPAAAVDTAERALGPLPEDYILFLREFGSVSVHHWEIYGVGPEVPPYLDVVVMTMEERATGGLPNDLIAIMNDGAGNLTCMTSAERSTRGIVLWWHSPAGREDPLAGSFTDWLLELVQRRGRTTD